MGKTKIKTIDDSKPVLGRRDELVEKLKAELGDVGQPRTAGIASGDARPKPTSKIQHPTSKTKPRSKKYQQTIKDLDRNKTYPLNEAVELVKKHSLTKFTGSLEAHILVVQAGLHGLVSLPHTSGKTEYKTESKAPVIHLGLGKLNQPTEELSANIKTLLQTLGKSRIKKVSLSPTMGPSVKLDLASV